MKDGYNELKYQVCFSDDKSEEVKCDFFLWNDENPVIISDIDGTVTKSNVRGMVFNYFGYDRTHEGKFKIKIRGCSIV
jgi:phosphatidate phosphatase LPIN